MVIEKLRVFPYFIQTVYIKPIKLGKATLKAIDSSITLPSIRNRYKNAVCSELNECDFPPLPFPATRCISVGLVCKPIYRLFKPNQSGLF